VDALDGIIIAGNASIDDASGADGQRDVPPTPVPTAEPAPESTAVPAAGTPAA
jgi:hypothetical protein